MRIYDISIPVRPGMIIYEGDPSFTIDRFASIADGALANVSQMTLGVHTGTHIDAPVHLIDGAAGIDAVPLDACLGPAVVVDATDRVTNLDAADIEALVPAEATRVLFKTRNGALWDRDRFSHDFLGLDVGAAQALVARGVRLVGIDYLSIASPADPVPTHVALLSAGVVIVEGLDLRAVPPGAYWLACLPMLLVGSDGAPARAVLIEGAFG